LFEVTIFSSICRKFHYIAISPIIVKVGSLTSLYICTLPISHKLHIFSGWRIRWILEVSIFHQVQRLFLHILIRLARSLHEAKASKYKHEQLHPKVFYIILIFIYGNLNLKWIYWLSHINWLTFSQIIHIKAKPTMSSVFACLLFFLTISKIQHLWKIFLFSHLKLFNEIKKPFLIPLNDLYDICGLL